MKITHEELKTMIREAVKAKLGQKKLQEKASSVEKEILPGSADIGSLVQEIDDFLMETADKAKSLCEKMEEEMKTDILGGTNPSLAPRIGERNRMLSTRIGVLKKLAGNCISIFEFIRREG